MLITGAGSGFGRGAAMALAELGHQVIGGAVSTDEAASLSAAHPNLVGRKLDVTDAGDLAAAAELEVDVLVNNAGEASWAPLPTSISTWFARSSR